MPILKAKEGALPETEEASDSVYYLSSEVLRGREVKPGDTLMLKVAEIGDGEIGVMYAEEDKPEPEMEMEAMGRSAFGES